MKLFLNNKKWMVKIENPETPEGRKIKDKWLPAEVPGCIHLDLMRNNVIPDPFIGLKEQLVQWVEKESWIYRCIFDVPEKYLETHNEEDIFLVFCGIDTIASIFLNGVNIGYTNNMFIPWDFPINGILKSEGNELLIFIKSPFRAGKELEEKHGVLPSVFDSSRVYLRKAQYSYGWDWGPRLATSGLWREVYIISHGSLRITDIFCKTRVESMKEAKVEVDVNLYSKRKFQIDLKIAVKAGSRVIEESYSECVIEGESKISKIISVKNPELWWPNGYGEQNLYNLEVILFYKGREMARENLRFGIRKIELIQEPDSEGNGFIFRINNRPIFCKGANWVPADNFLSRISRHKYEKLLRMAANTHINMLRVWGGGVYENDSFYDLCDELGIMVWQDFMFSCAMYPEEPWFFNLINLEAEKIIKRLRNHPGLVIWCGNNENEWGSVDWWASDTDKFHGEAIYHKILPSVCSRLDPTRPYIPSSPYGGKHPNSEEEGDNHVWNVWSWWQSAEHYEDNKGRFISEFGFQAFPDIKTVEAFIESSENSIDSEVLMHHNKQKDGMARVKFFIEDSFNIKDGLNNFIYLSQINQADALKRGVEHWRRRKFKTSGALYWQLNDCWPGISWSVIDSSLLPKAAYFYSKRFFAPVLVSIDFDDQCGKFRVWVINDYLKDIVGKIFVTHWTFHGKRKRVFSSDLKITGNSARIVHQMDKAEFRISDPCREFLSVELICNGEKISENNYLFRKIKFLKLPQIKPQITLKVIDKHSCSFKISSHVFMKDVYLNFKGLDYEISDNYFDMLPESVREILVKFKEGITEDRVKGSVEILTLNNL